MAKNRMGRINEEIQRELAALLRTVKDPRLQEAMLTVTRADTSSDLSYAKIFISVFPAEQGKEVLKGLKSAAGYLRRELGAALQLRHTPQLQFCLDDSMEHGAHILDLLHHVKLANPANEHIHLEDED